MERFNPLNSSQKSLHKKLIFTKSLAYFSSKSCTAKVLRANDPAFERKISSLSRKSPVFTAELGSSHIYTKPVPLVLRIRLSLIQTCRLLRSTIAVVITSHTFTFGATMEWETVGEGILMSVVLRKVLESFGSRKLMSLNSSVSLLDANIFGTIVTTRCYNPT